MTDTPANNGKIGIDRLVEDLHAVLEDADALLRATAGNAGEKVEQARAKVEESVRHARERLSVTEEELTRRAREMAQDADQYVRANPWRAVGIGAAAGFVLGLLFARR